MRTVRTTCPYCAVQCNFDLTIENNLVERLQPTKACPVANGTVCKKGLASLHDLRHPDRLTTPLLREHGRLREATWDDAWTFLRARLEPLVQHTPERIGVFGSGSLTNEKTYLLGKLARLGLRTPNIDYNGRYCMSSAATALHRTFALDRGLGFELSDLTHADVIVLVGANVAETLPPILQYLKAAKDRGTIVYTVDPRATVTANFSHHHLPVRPGTDDVLALGLLRALEEAGRVRPSAPAHSVPDVLAAAREVTPDVVANRCGIPSETFEQFARTYLHATSPLILTGRGAEQHARGTETVHAWINVAFLAGHFGKIGAGYGTLTGQGNGQGGREHGQKSDQLPGARSIRDPRHRQEIADLWGCAETDLPNAGRSAQELLTACGTDIDALLVLGSNPAVSAAGTTDIRRRLERLGTLVVIDFLPSETALMADLVLPGSMWAEEEGTTTNLEGRVQRRRRAITAPGSAREDWRILCDVAHAVGRGEFFTYDSFEDLQREFFAATRGGTADYSGLSAHRLDERTFQWPVPHATHPGTKQPYQPPYPTPDGKAHLHPVGLLDEPTFESSFDLRLTTGRLGGHYQSGTQTRRNPTLKGTLEAHVHPHVAARHDLRTGDRVQLRTPHGTTELPVKITPGIRPDTVFVPFHWPDSANDLTAPHDLDPFSRMPAFKLAPLRLEPLVSEEASTVPPLALTPLT